MNSNYFFLRELQDVESTREKFNTKQESAYEIAIEALYECQKGTKGVYIHFPFDSQLIESNFIRLSQEFISTFLTKVKDTHMNMLSLNEKNFNIYIAKKNKDLHFKPRKYICEKSYSEEELIEIKKSLPPKVYFFDLAFSTSRLEKKNNPKSKQTKAGKEETSKQLILEALLVLVLTQNLDKLFDGENHAVKNRLFDKIQDFLEKNKLRYKGNVGQSKENIKKVINDILKKYQ